MAGIFNRRRFGQWLAVIRYQTGIQSRPKLLRMSLSMSWLLLTFIMRGRLSRYSGQWRARMRKCARCPVYDAALRQCYNRLGDGQEFGCACYMPFKALLVPHGWGWTRFEDQKLCW